MLLRNALAIYILFLCNGIKSQMNIPMQSSAVQLTPNNYQIPQNINMPPSFQFPISNYMEKASQEDDTNNEILKTAIINEFISRKKSSKKKPIIELAVLKRLKRSPYSYEDLDEHEYDEPETAYLFDFLIDNYLHFVIRDLNQKGYIEKNGTTTHMVREVFTNLIVKSQFYLASTRQIDDSMGTCETLNTPRWWTKKITVPGYRKSQKLIDVFFEAFLRQVFKWLCENKYISSRKTPLKVAAHGLACTKKTQIYQIITNKHAVDDIGLWKTVSTTDWWLQLGTLRLEGNVLKWYPIENYPDYDY